MALTHQSERNCGTLYEIAKLFCSKCLMEDGSLLFEDSAIWSLENLERLNAALTPDESNRSFMEKLKDQLKSAGPQGIRLAAEVLCIYFLFPSDISGKRKREVVSEVLSWAGNNDNLPSQIAHAFDVNIGSTGGQSYNSRRYDEMKFLIEFAIAWKRLTSGERQAAIADPWLFQERVDSIEGGESRQLRHILLHLLFPDLYERISSGNHKARIIDAFAGLISEPTDNAEKELYQIRKVLEKLLPNQSLDFYWKPLESAWKGEADEENAVSLDVIKYKKQIILYGPPGTGKTYTADKLAERLIRSEALKKRGAAKYFQSEDEIKKAVKTNIRTLQLHPAYSYEDFIRGLHVTSGTTEYRLGFLPNLVNEMDKCSQSERLPYVLILDEINRTDLSRMLGEGFSLLENRGKSLSLPAHDINGQAINLRIPDDLYVIPDFDT